jgi:hypothetical protein
MQMHRTPPPPSVSALRYQFSSTHCFIKSLEAFPSLHADAYSVGTYVNAQTYLASRFLSTVAAQDSKCRSVEEYMKRGGYCGRLAVEEACLARFLLKKTFSSLLIGSIVVFTRSSWQPCVQQKQR